MRNIILLETQQLVQASLKCLLTKHSLFESIETASNGKHLFEILRGNDPFHIILISTTLDDMSINALIKKLKRDQPEIKLVILANENNAILAQKYLNAGADGYLAKTDDETQFVNSIKKVLQNKSVFPEFLTNPNIADKNSEGKKSPFEELSEREMDILLLMVKGKTVKEISSILHLSPKTISTYKGRIFEKLNANSLMDIFILAIEFGLIDIHNYA